MAEISKPSPPWLDDPDYLPLINEALTPYINGESAATLAAILKKIYQDPKKGSETLSRLLEFLRLSDKPIQTLSVCARDPSICNAIIARCNEYPDSCQALATMTGPKFDGLGKDKGAGKPHCLPIQSRVLFTLTTSKSEDKVVFRVSDLSITAKDKLTDIGINVDNGMELSLSDFTARFSRLAMASCQHTVRYDDGIRDLDVYKTVNSYFFLSNP